MPSLLEPSATSSFFIPPPPHIPSLFPYTTLFRSGTEAERFRTEVDGQFGTLDRQLRGFLGHRPDLVGQHGAGDYHHAQFPAVRQVDAAEFTVQQRPDVRQEPAQQLLADDAAAVQPAEPVQAGRLPQVFDVERVNHERRAYYPWVAAEDGRGITEPGF